MIGLGCLLRATCFVLIAAVLSPAVEAAEPKVLRRGTADEPRSLDPQFVPGNSGAAIMYEMFEGLVSYDPAGNVIGGNAESWTVSDDGLTYVFKLRPNLKWSDGQPLTAADFIYSFQRAIDPAAATRAARVMYAIKNARQIVKGEMPPASLAARAVDPRTIEIILEQPTPYFPELVASFSSAPVPRHAIEKFGEKWTLPGNIATNGAYTLKEWVNGSDIKLAKNPNYYGAAAVKIDEVIFYPIEKPGTALTRFRAGEIDIVFSIPPDRLEWLQQNLPKELRSEPVTGVYYLLLNDSREIMSDVRVRKALSYALDRDAIIRLLEPGYVPATNIVPAAMPGYGANPMPYQAVPIAERQAEARELLKQAGYGPAKPLKFVFKSGGQEHNRRIAVAVQAMWRQVGVEAEIESVGARAIAMDSVSGNFDAMRYTYYAPYLDPMSFLKLIEGGSTTNFSRYANPKFDALLSEADRIRDPQARIAKMKEAERLAFEDHPLIPLYFLYRYYLISQRVKNWETNVRGEHLARYLDVE